MALSVIFPTFFLSSAYRGNISQLYNLLKTDSRLRAVCLPGDSQEELEPLFPCHFRVHSHFKID